MKIKTLILVAGLLWSPVFLSAQVAINNDGSAPAAGAMVDITSVTSGLLIPRMSIQQLEAIVDPPEYMMAINTDTKKVCIYESEGTNIGWEPVNTQGLVSGSGEPTDSVNTDALYYDELIDRFYVHDGQNWNIVDPDSDDWESVGDDMISLATGNIGIGTSNPEEKLHVEGSVRMVDGNQAAGYLMVSDADGTATWINPDSIQTASTGVGGYTMQWGGSLRSNAYAKYGGTSDGPGSVSSDYSTKGVVPVSGSITKFSWSSRSADNTSKIDIIIHNETNGTSHNYVFLTGDIGILTIPSIAVSEGDIIEIKGTNTGTTPYQTGMTFYIN